MSASQTQVSCDLAGESAILEFSQGIYYGLDEIGARVWRMLDKPIVAREIIQQLLQEYEVEESTLWADVSRLLAELLDKKLIQVKAGS